MKTLAERLTAARTEKGLSQQALAKLAGVAQSTIGGLEVGSRESARKITAIADALGVSVTWLADGKGPREPMGVAQSMAHDHPQPKRQLQWVEDSEAEILSLYRAMAEETKGTALTVLKSLPKAIADERSRDDRGRDQG
jgi:transcriptional regulator with XRE-family HTH domain